MTIFDDFIFKFQYDNTLSWIAELIMFSYNSFKFQYDNTLRMIHQFS